jgi:hypothetical protein
MIITEARFGSKSIGKNPVLVDVEITDEEIAAEAEGLLEKARVSNRSTRDGLLTMSDWTQGSDSPLAEEKKTEWATYRASLRDITSHENWPDLEDDDWPTEPT